MTGGSHKRAFSDIHNVLALDLDTVTWGIQSVQIHQAVHLYVERESVCVSV